MSMRSLLFSSCAVALSVALPRVAAAQASTPAPSSPNCPPGSWFCAETTQTPAASAGQPVLQPLPPPPPAGGPAPPAVVYQPPPPVVVYQNPQTRYYVVPPPPPVYYYRSRHPHRSEWGINLHLEGAAFGHAAGVGGSGMGGGGLGIRYRPVPVFALETDLDFVGGRDYNGFRRDEEASTINGLLFLNPRSRAQIYLLAGFGWSWAHVSDNPVGPGWAADYTYFGGQGGVGLEFRAAKHFALNFDARAFIRTRTDDQASFSPEFTNSSGQTTNTSAGALFTGGMTFYF